MNSTHKTYRDYLAEAMQQALSSSMDTIIIGQGVTDFKGIFGTTTNLYTNFPDRVIETPLSEEGITGICVGLALRGMYPINTHIRADFGLLAANQIINMAAKYKYMFGGHYSVPMLIRMVIGRSWGQGAQHSQSLQSLFAHIPGLTVIMPACTDSVKSSYSHAISQHKGPVISFEHRLLYDIAFEGSDLQGSKSSPFSSRLIRKGNDVTIVATSIMVLESMRAAIYLSDYDIDCEIIDVHNVSQPDSKLIMSSLEKTGHLLIADTSWLAYGVCAEVCRIVTQSNPGVLRAPVVTLGMSPTPCPTSQFLEDHYYPELHNTVDAIARLATGKSDHGIPIPKQESMTKFYKSFRGPF